MVDGTVIISRHVEIISPEKTVICSSPPLIKEKSDNESSESDLDIDTNTNENPMPREQVQEEQHLRRSDRQRTSTNYLDNYILYVNITNVNSLKKEAVASPESQNWKKSMQKEFNHIQSNDTWQLVPFPENKVIINCRCIFIGKVCKER